MFIGAYMSRDIRKPTMLSPNTSDTNRTVQAQEMARDGNVWIRGIVLPCSDNKGDDQLRSYCAFNVFAYVKYWFSNDAAHISISQVLMF